MVVDCPTEVARDRLVLLRGMTLADAQARIDAQMGRAQRLALADWVVDNSGSREALEAEVERLWAWLEQRRRGSGPPA